MKAKQECATKHGVSEAVMKDEKQAPEDKKCYYKCLGEASELMDANGNLNPNNFKAKMRSLNAPAELIDGIDKCVGSSYIFPDPCDTALAVHKCVHGL